MSCQCLSLRKQIKNRYFYKPVFKKSECILKTFLALLNDSWIDSQSSRQKGSLSSCIDEWLLDRRDLRWSDECVHYCTVTSLTGGGRGLSAGLLLSAEQEPPRWTGVRFPLCESQSPGWASIGNGLGLTWVTLFGAIFLFIIPVCSLNHQW